MAASTPSDSPAALIDARIAELGDWRGATLARVRQLIHKAVPGVVEAWKWRGVPTWEHDGILCTGETYKDKVKLTFAKGASLADPTGLFNASLDGNVRRAIDIAEGETIDAKAFTALVRDAAALNAATKAPAKKTAAKKTAAKKTAAKKTAAKKTAAAKAGAKTSPAEKAAPAKNAPAIKKAAATKLLSGGNPQIAKGEGDGPVQAYIDALPGWKRDVGARLDALITRAAPKARKAVKWNSPFYGIEGQGWIVSVHAFSRYLTVTFFDGARLDPEPPGRGKDDAARWIDVHEDGLDEKLLTKWVKQAARNPGWQTTDIM